MKNENILNHAAPLNDNELENINGGFLGLLTAAFLGACAVGTGLGFLVMKNADDYEAYDK